MGPYYNSDILFQSNISILHLTNRTNRSNRQKFMWPYYNSDIFLSLANDTGLTKSGPDRIGSD